MRLTRAVGIWPNPPIVFARETGFSIVRYPNASTVREKKSRLDREADRLLEVRAPKPARRMYGKLQQVWPVVLEARSRGESVAKIARRLRIKPHTIAHHLALSAPKVA
jgi:DNA-binding NarL/FixJ family response regulator